MGVFHSCLFVCTCQEHTHTYTGEHANTPVWVHPDVSVVFFAQVPPCFFRKGLQLTDPVIPTIYIGPGILSFSSPQSGISNCQSLPWTFSLFHSRVLKIQTQVLILAFHTWSNLSSPCSTHFQSKTISWAVSFISNICVCAFVRTCACPFASVYCALGPRDYKNKHHIA